MRGKLRVVRQTAIRIGVVACVGIACVTGAGRLDDTIAVFDFRADLNAAATYRERVYPESRWVAGYWRVLEDARLRMPEGATYRIVEGPRFNTGDHSGHAGYFLLGLLLPRRQTDSESARWVFCYGCEPTTLGARFRVLSDSGDGLLFGRMQS